jgi:hypothetical protein
MNRLQFQNRAAFQHCLSRRQGIRSGMRWLLILLITVLMAGSLAAAESRVLKVLPQFLDQEGRHALTPSLYDRDAYQAFLRKNPTKRLALRFAVQYKGVGIEAGGLKLKLEVRGVAQSDTPPDVTVSLPVPKNNWFSHWAYLKIDQQEFKKIGEVTAWRVTLWDGDRLVNEQKSFLW